MANTVLNPSIIAAAAVRILDNELVMANKVYRAYEGEYAKKVNGYEAGDTISIRKPAQFTVRSANVSGGGTAVASAQDATEGKLTMQVATQAGVDFKFTSAELTLKIEELADRVIRPAMVQLANKVDLDLMALYKDVYNWAGPDVTTGAATAGNTLDSFLKFSQAPKRLDLTAVPQDSRNAVFHPNDWWGLANSQTVLFPTGIANPAYRQGEIGMIGGVSSAMGQNVPTHTVGTKAGSPTVNGGAQGVAYSSVLNTEAQQGIQNLVTQAWTASSAILKKGDVFVIAGVFAVNPVTKATLSYLQPFVVQADVSSDGAGAATISISPAIIAVNGPPNTIPFATVSAVPANAAAITVFGTASAQYNQNLVFHKNAFALAVVPLVKPPGSVDCARESYKGLSVRLIPYYDGTNDISNYRLDILYGVKTVDQRLATRLTSS